MALWLSFLSLDAWGTHLDSILAVVGVLGVLGAIWRWTSGKVKAWNRKFDALNALATHELNHNSGKSVKDQATKAALHSREALKVATKAADSSERAAKGVDLLSQQFSNFLQATKNEHDAIWKAIEHGKIPEDHPTDV